MRKLQIVLLLLTIIVLLIATAHDINEEEHFPSLESISVQNIPRALTQEQNLEVEFDVDAAPEIDTQPHFRCSPYGDGTVGCDLSRGYESPRRLVNTTVATILKDEEVKNAAEMRMMLIDAYCRQWGLSRWKEAKYHNPIGHPWNQVFLQKKIITADIAKWIVYEAEKYAANYGWTVKRHTNYPTVDIEIKSIPRLHYYVHSFIYRKIVPLLGELYPIPEDWLGIDEVFVVKYTPTTQSSLAIHQDGDDFSFVIMLNDAFEGGGTAFPFLSNNNTHTNNANSITTENSIDSSANDPGTSVSSGAAVDIGETVRLPLATIDSVLYDKANMQIGDILLFNGRNPHTGLEITAGERYILTGFLSIGETKYCNNHF